VFGVLRVNLTHVIYISIVEASEGWRREIRHPSGNMIEIYANGPTNIGHFLEMKGYGLLNRKKTPISHGNLLLWVQVKDVDEVSVEQLDNLNLRGGAYYARIKEWGDQPFQSTKNEPYFLFLYGAPAVEHGKLLEAGTR
jgi:DnaJ-class molecular chaperone